MSQGSGLSLWFQNAKRGIEHFGNSFGHFPFISHESKKLVTSVLKAWGENTTLLNNCGPCQIKKIKKYPQKVQESCFVSMEEIHFKLYKKYKRRRRYSTPLKIAELLYKK